MTSNSKTNVKSNLATDQNEEKNDFLEKSNHSMDKSNASKQMSSPKGKSSKDEISECNQEDLDRSQDEVMQDVQEDGQRQNEYGEQNEEEFQKNSRFNQSRVYDQTSGRQEEQQNSSQHYQTVKQSQNINSNSENSSQKQLKSLLTTFKHELSIFKSSQTLHQQLTASEQQRKISELQTNIQILQIKLRLHKKLKTRKQLISFERINHLETIFKHYCTHIFKTGKHMTFDRLQYEKVHLTIDRLSVFLKDFNLTTIKMKDNRTRQIIEKQQIIKLFKKISPNCRDLDFQQFILILQKIGQLYFDSKVTYEERKQNQRKQRLKIKENLEKKEKYKQQMLKKHHEKLQRLEKSIVQNEVDEMKERTQTEGGENDDLIQKMINEDPDKSQPNKQSRIQEGSKKQNLVKGKKSASLYSRTFKRQIDTQQKQQKQQNPLLNLTKQEKIEYFYQIINVDDIQSFSNKMRQLNLPLFKIYAGKEQNSNKQTQKSQRQDEIALSQASKIETEDQKRLKELREKLNQRNQKIKHGSVPSLSKEDYEFRKLKRSRMQEQAAEGIKIQRKPKKIDLSEGEINLSSLSKLAYENINFTKFNPKSFYRKEEDDQIFMQEYGDSPVRKRNNQAKTQLSKVSQNTKRLIEEKDKNSENFLQKLKQRQSEIQINQKKQEVSQLYRFNDRTQRQKRLIDKFLQKNK